MELSVAISIGLAVVGFAAGLVGALMSHLRAAEIGRLNDRIERLERQVDQSRVDQGQRIGRHADQIAELVAARAASAAHHEHLAASLDTGAALHDAGLAMNNTAKQIDRLVTRMDEARGLAHRSDSIPAVVPPRPRMGSRPGP